MSLSPVSSEPGAPIPSAPAPTVRSRPETAATCVAGDEPASPLAAVAARLRAAGCVLAEEEAELLLGAAADPAELDRLVGRRAAGTPLEYVLGWAEFCGQRFVIEDGVFVPRHRTAFLVDVATGLALARRATAATASPSPAAKVETGRARTTLVVDLCCGSGALGAVLAARLRSGTLDSGMLDSGTLRSGELDLHAADLDPAAVRCARRNVAPLGGRVYEGDLYAALPAALLGRVDLLVANAPYVPTEAMELLPPEAREHESPVALDGGSDGLAVLRRVIADAPRWLAVGGHLLAEASAEQAAALTAVVRAAGLIAQTVHSREHEVTVVVATRPANAGDREAGT